MPHTAYIFLISILLPNTDTKISKEDLIPANLNEEGLDTPVNDLSARFLAFSINSSESDLCFCKNTSLGIISFMLSEAINLETCSSEAELDIKNVTLACMRYNFRPTLTHILVFSFNLKCQTSKFFESAR